MALPDRMNDSPTITKRVGWPYDGQRFVGSDFMFLARLAIMQSSINNKFFRIPVGSERPDRITSCAFSIFIPNPHEQPNTIRFTGSGNLKYWARTSIDPITEVWSHDPTAHHEYFDSGFAIGLYSRVGLGFSRSPGRFFGWGHFPMLDITKPATDKNIHHVINEIQRRTGLEKFYIIRSSRHGMMLFAPELVDEPHLLAFWNEAELMNHVEVTGRRLRRPLDYWFDSRWHARSQQNHKDRLGTPNKLQVGGIMRLNEAPPLKPDRPMVVAASFD